jgi:hypothetical protein
MISIPVLTLSVFGFTYLLRWLDGPFHILKRFRMLVGIRYVLEGSEEVEEVPEDNQLAKLVACFWCLSTWVSIFFSLAYILMYRGTVVDWFFCTFACVAVSGMLNEIVWRLKDE